MCPKLDVLNFDEAGDETACLHFSEHFALFPSDVKFISKKHKSIRAVKLSSEAPHLKKEIPFHIFKSPE